MPLRRRKLTLRRGLTEHEVWEMVTGRFVHPDSALRGMRERELRAVYGQHRDQILAHPMNPGRAPWAYWHFEDDIPPDLREEPPYPVSYHLLEDKPAPEGYDAAYAAWKSIQDRREAWILQRELGL